MILFSWARIGPIQQHISMCNTRKFQIFLDQLIPPQPHGDLGIKLDKRALKIDSIRKVPVSWDYISISDIGMFWTDVHCSLTEQLWSRFKLLTILSQLKWSWIERITHIWNGKSYTYTYTYTVDVVATALTVRFCKLHVHCAVFLVCDRRYIVQFVVWCVVSEWAVQ